MEKAGYFQSITVGVAPIVMVIASVVTFSVHMVLGFDLTAAQVSEPLGLGRFRDATCRDALVLLFLDLEVPPIIRRYFFSCVIKLRSGRVEIQHLCTNDVQVVFSRLNFGFNSEDANHPVIQIC